MARKVVKRAVDVFGDHTPAENDAWLRENAQDPAAIAERIDPDMWAEAVQFGNDLRARAERILPGIPYDLGAGGDYEFLYWLTRVRQPDVIVETGVCAGWTSQAFLAALHRNGHGELHSSDFPLFRLPDPESVIGCLVDPALKDRWHLHLDGDEVALPRILDSVDHVDLFHYDSDKSYSGREFAYRQIQSKLAADGLIVMDDLHNNAWFYDKAALADGPFWVFQEPGRYGVLGELG